MPSKTDHFNIYNGKPYNYFGDYLRSKYGFRIFKLPVNAFLGCPNRVNGHGCIFCSESGSASPSIGEYESIYLQMQNAKNSFNRTSVETRYIAYFQAYTNTAAKTDKLKKLYDEALAFPDVMGLMIGTRPDEIDEDTANLISAYRSPDFELWVELGMQSSHDKSLDYLNRMHSFNQTRDSILLLAGKGIQVSVHIILGIPGESWNDMMNTAEIISSLPVSGVKIHHLHVLKNTPLCQMYKNGEVDLLDFESYISILTDFIERLRNDITIHRIAGDAPEDILVAPKWGLEKGTVQQRLIDEFNSRCTWQGFLFKD